MHEALAKTAPRFAQYAMAALVKGDAEVFVLHAATAFEHLAKARLAKIHPALISGSDFDSLLFFCSTPPPTKLPTKPPRSITVTETVKRLAQIERAFRADEMKAALHLLAEARNGVAHIGRAPGQGVAGSIVVTFARACNALLGQLSLTREEFWGAYLSNIDERLSAAASEARIKVVDAITRANEEFVQRFGPLEKDAADAMIRIAEAYSDDRYQGHVVECPACGRKAFLFGEHSVDWEGEYEYEGPGEYSLNAYPAVTFTGGHLHCRPCGLVLEGVAELEAADVEREWTVEGDLADSLAEEDLLKLNSSYDDE